MDIYCPSPEKLKNASESASFDDQGYCSVDIDSMSFMLFKNGAIPFDSEEECTSALKNSTFRRAYVDVEQFVACEYDVNGLSGVWGFSTPFPTTSSGGYVPDIDNPNSWRLLYTKAANCRNLYGSTDVTDCPVVEG